MPTVERTRRPSLGARLHAKKRPAEAVAAPVEPAAKSPAKPKAKAKKKRPMSQAEKQRHDYSPERVAFTFSRVLSATMKAAQNKYRDPTICVANEAAVKVIGVSLPALSIEYVLQNNVWPLERVVQVVGREGTCKSFFTFEVCRWFRKFGGGGILFENETKYSPEAAMSILGYDGEVLGYTPCANLEDWQSKLQWFIQQTKHDMLGTTPAKPRKDGKDKKVKVDPMKRGKGPGKVYPTLYILDSLMGKLSAESMQNIETTGHVSRAHPLEALKITPFLKQLPSLMQRWPMAFLCTNHLKKGQSAGGGQPERRKAGGVALDFQETFELQLNRGMKFHIVNSKYEGVNLELRCYKNSLGTTGRRLQVAVHWKNIEGPDGTMRQVTTWQWHAATTRLLLGFGPKTEIGEKIREIVDLKGCAGEKVLSRALKTGTKPISYHEAGVRINKNKAMKNALRKLLGIKVRKLFEPGVDYDKQLKLAEIPMLEKVDAE